MANLQNNLLDIFYMDTLAAGKTCLHELDPRAKVFTTLIFVAIVVSFNKYEISMLLPFFFYLIVTVTLADLPIIYLIKKMMLLIPFAFFIGIFNPLIDREILIQIYNIEVSGGWISFFSIMIRFCLTVGAVLILICTTGFDSICMALQRFGVPSPFIVQLMFLYRYMFVLIEEASKMVRARNLRNFDSGNVSFRLFVPIIGQLLLRTLDRAQRIHIAMCCRGFNGNIQLIRQMTFATSDILFTAGWCIIFVFLRLYNIPAKFAILINWLLIHLRVGI